MTAMFPDSGVIYTDAKYSLPNPSIVNCNPLWYSTSRCQPRFDPAALNAMLAELINLINRGEVVYDCNRLDNVERAVRYIVQRGLPRGATGNYGPNYYYAYLDPTTTRYNDYMTLTLVPGTTNTGPSFLNVDNLGWAPILRNDGTNVLAADLIAGCPLEVAYWGGSWRCLGLLPSQIPAQIPPPPPLIISGTVDLWIRTDGSDSHDGSANSPDKAFRTINGAWASAAGRYVSTPMLTLHFRLGIPGTYESGSLGPFGGKMILSGDPGNVSNYRIVGAPSGGGHWVCLGVGSCTDFTGDGLTFVRDGNPPYDAYNVWCGNSVSNFSNCVFDNVVSNEGSFFMCQKGWTTVSTDTVFLGHGGNFSNAIIANFGAFFGVSGIRTDFYDCHFTHAGFAAGGVSHIKWDTNTTLGQSGCTGPQYYVYENSVINLYGRTPPGNSGGASAMGGQFG